ncbi:MAG: GMC family oxidoreductase [Pirellulaceae bacterium]|nr:GMC family oxidoreductase [Pirellulaceae bacterium]
MTDESVPTQQCEICIVGTGAAGGILAYRLASAGRHVVSLEQGGPIDNDYFTNDRSAESLPKFGLCPEMKWPMPASEGYLYANHQASRLYAKADTSATTASSEERFVNRQIFRLNGKLNLWNAVALRMSPRDFRGRDHGDSDTNWAIGYDDLEHHYSSVEQLIGVCGTTEHLDVLPDGKFIPPLPLRPADEWVMKSLRKIRGDRIQAIPTRKAVETRLEKSHHCRSCGECVFGCRYGSTYKFSSHLLPQIQQRSNFHIRYHCKVSRLLREPETSRIRIVDCIDTRTGQKFRIEPRIVILATGALETPRILFNSGDAVFPSGLANRSGLLGCYLQDKVRAMVAAPLLRRFGDRTPYAADCGDHLLIPRFALNRNDIRGGFQAQVCHVLPRHPYYVEGLMPFPSWTRKWLAKRLFRTFVALLFLGKPEAQKSNRVVVSPERDRYGVPKLDVQYRFSQNDLRMRAEMVYCGKKIIRKCSGVLTNVFDDDLPGSTIHYAGTCRLAAKPSNGVVDINLRSFDHPNLYLCDGSVMPEMSEKNLTLTIMALADRLASRLLTDE